jgi:hypothetical protein
MTVSPPSEAISAPPLLKSQREGNSPLSSPIRLSSNIILSPATKSYLDHSFIYFCFSSFCTSIAELVSVTGLSVFFVSEFVGLLLGSLLLPPFLIVSTDLSIASSAALFNSLLAFFLSFFHKSIITFPVISDLNLN